MPIELADTHCHLDFDAFDNDRNLVLERARGSGIIKILIPGINTKTSKTAVLFAHEYPDVYAAVGVHPNDGFTWNSNTTAALGDLANDHRVVAIGEIGLDFYRDHTTPGLQVEIFEKQLDIAAQLNLPVVIHNREADNAIWITLQSWHEKLVKRNLVLAENPGVMHSFSSDKDFARALVGINFKIGITGPVTYKNAIKIRDVILYLSLDDIVLETDAPFLAPHPYRGKRNEPANVRIIAEKVAELKGVTLDHVALKTTFNADKLFGWRENR